MKITMDPVVKETCWKIIRELAPDSLSWNHYDLAQLTDLPYQDTWKDFLLQPDVSDWLNEERKLLQQYELTKLTTNVSKSRSLGQAQLINAVEKINAKNQEQTATGPIFVYCYVPLNEAQKSAPNVQVLEEDIFLDGVYKPPSLNDQPTFVFDPNDPNAP